MELLERIWELLSGFGNGILGRFERGITALFGSANARYLKHTNPRVAAITALEPTFQALTDEELRGRRTSFASAFSPGKRSKTCWSRRLPFAVRRVAAFWGCGTTMCS